jgi:hypothetical protein
VTGGIVNGVEERRDHGDHVDLGHALRMSAGSTSGNTSISSSRSGRSEPRATRYWPRFHFPLPGPRKAAASRATRNQRPLRSRPAPVPARSRAPAPARIPRRCMLLRYVTRRLRVDLDADQRAALRRVGGSAMVEAGWRKLHVGTIDANICPCRGAQPAHRCRPSTAVRRPRRSRAPRPSG